ncbi:unnamed protein product [Adineta steineri]|uniref:Uncharacterized protein n=1 Tax=Adineta steineri TaxID=433720 RepID=A0A815PCH9_9BILA|nr:unnamed protein product [Adineta steineri]CAF1447603.1 unnamed protein product [Adineta steineri]CAF3672585.1 unnamed protein product [Adineta steineri]CAF4039377.1 unnamed protein product [Adineta steineri]
MAALGHCEDPACIKKPPTHGLVRIFRCSLHCNRNLCLSHLNDHNVSYEKEKNQNDTIKRELESSLKLYQTLFEQQIATYDKLVCQATTILSHNLSTLIPTEQIRNVLFNVRQAITLYQQKLIFKKETETIDSLVKIKNEENRKMVTPDDDDNVLSLQEDTDNDVTITLNDPPINVRSKNINVNTRVHTKSTDDCESFTIRIPLLEHIGTNSTSEIIHSQEQLAAEAYAKKRSTEGAKSRGKVLKRIQK